ncbi:5099_t:CDS:2 [Rhizophagus irregularis]|nr:5099_t:CDS:2 [Rhizophagus irregularis]
MCNNGSIQNIEEIKDGELIFAELETYLYEAKKIGIEQHQAKN